MHGGLTHQKVTLGQWRRKQERVRGGWGIPQENFDSEIASEFLTEFFVSCSINFAVDCYNRVFNCLTVLLECLTALLEYLDLFDTANFDWY